MPLTAGRAAQPNVILVITDDQGYGDMSCHGNPVLKTPNLGALHAQGVRFDCDLKQGTKRRSRGSTSRTTVPSVMSCATLTGLACRAKP